MNKDPINVLKIEHGNMCSILLLVRAQLDLIAASHTADFVLLANALHYMRKFPSQVHHPKEDMIFTLLSAKDPSIREQVAHASREHAHIYELEDWLIERALDVPRPGTVARARLLEFGRHYLQLQRAHSEREEQRLFPRAQELLSDQDWAEVAKKFNQIDDPLFGKHGQDRYVTLYEHLMREAKCA